MLAAIFGVTAFIIVNILAINNYAYTKSGEVHCENYVLNTYLYVMLGFMIMGMVFLLDERFHYFKMLGSIMMILALGIIIFGLVIWLMMMKPADQVMAHLVWTVLMTGLGLLVGGVVSEYTSKGATDIVLKAIVATMGLTALVGVLGYKYGAKWISIDFERWLNWALIGLVVLSVAGLFLGGVKHIDKFFDFLAVAGVIIFTLLLLAYHKNLRIRAQQCKKPLYPQESFGLIIKIVNLFMDLLRLMGRSRRR